MFYFFLTISNTAMIQFGYSGDFTGIIGFVYVIVGTLVGSFIIQLFDKNIDLGLKIVSMVNFLAFIVLFFVMAFRNVENARDLSNQTWFTVCLICLY